MNVLLAIRNNITGHLMYASLADPTKDELKKFKSFYQSKRERGLKKYTIEKQDTL